MKGHWVEYLQRGPFLKGTVHPKIKNCSLLAEVLCIHLDHFRLELQCFRGIDRRDVILESTDGREARVCDSTGSKQQWRPPQLSSNVQQEQMLLPSVIGSLIVIW